MKDLIAFSAIKTFYNSERDLLDIVCGFVLHQIGENVNNAESLKIQINKEFTLDIPSDIIHSALKRLRNKYRFIDCVAGYTRVVLTSEGIGEQRKNHTAVEQIKKQYDDLIIDLKKFIEMKKGIEISRQSAADYLKDAILNSPSDVFRFVFPSTTETQAHTKALSIVGEYVFEQERKNSQIFEVLKSIIYGNILASALESGKIGAGGNLNKLNIYFDSNIIFSLLKLDDEFHNNAAAEMLKVLKSFNVGLNVFSFTLEEIKAKLFSYTGKYHAYVHDIEVDSIYYRIREKGLDEADVMLLAENLEDSLGQFNIVIDYFYGSVELLDVDKELSSRLVQKKEERLFEQRDGRQIRTNHKHPATIEHDLLAIRAIKKIRGRSFDRIESSKAIFLTADGVLTRFDYEEYGHFEKRTIPEVFFRTQLVSFLWFKNPEISTKLPICDLLSGYIQTKMISEKLWDTFIWELKKQVEQNKYKKEDIATLISLKETKSVLAEIQEGNRDYSEEIKKKIIDSNLIEKARKIREEGIELKRYQEEAERILKEKDKQVEVANLTLIGVGKKIEKSCFRFWNCVINCSIFGILLVGMIVLVWFGLFYDLSLDDALNFIIKTRIILGFLVLIILIVISIIKKRSVILIPFLVDMRKNFENKLIQQCIKKKKKAFGIPEE